MELEWRRSTRCGAAGDCVEVAWQKSSRSATNGNCLEMGVWTKSSLSADTANCVEVKAGWTKSSHSLDNGTCVEVRAAPSELYVRDTKDRAGPVLAFRAGPWTAFVAAIKGGDLDL